MISYYDITFICMISHVISHMILSMQIFISGQRFACLERVCIQCLFKSELLLLEYATKRFKNAPELKELIQGVPYHPDFNLDSEDRDLHKRLMKAEDSDIEINVMWEEGDED